MSPVLKRMAGDWRMRVALVSMVVIFSCMWSWHPACVIATYLAQCAIWINVGVQIIRLRRFQAIRNEYERTTKTALKMMKGFHELDGQIVSKVRMLSILEQMEAVAAAQNRAAEKLEEHLKK